jgi:hypothetical protein
VADQADDRDFPPTWFLLRPLPESDRHPGSKTARMRRALKGLLRGYGIRVGRISNVGPNGQPADESVPAGPDEPGGGATS